MKITIEKITDAYEFCNITGRQPFQVHLKSGTHCVDARSQLGIFSLDLSTPCDLICDVAADGSHDEALEAYKKAIDKWLVK